MHALLHVAPAVVVTPTAVSLSTSVLRGVSLRVGNLRDLSSVDLRQLSSGRAMRPNAVLRSASPANLTREEVRFLQHDLGLRSVIDLRAQAEAEKDVGARRLSRAAGVTTQVYCAHTHTHLHPHTHTDTDTHTRTPTPAQVRRGTTPLPSQWCTPSPHSGAPPPLTAVHPLPSRWCTPSPYGVPPSLTVVCPLPSCSSGAAGGTSPSPSAWRAAPPAGWASRTRGTSSSARHSGVPPPS